MQSMVVLGPLISHRHPWDAFHRTVDLHREENSVPLQLLSSWDEVKERTEWSHRRQGGGVHIAPHQVCEKVHVRLKVRLN